MILEPNMELDSAEQPLDVRQVSKKRKAPSSQSSLSTTLSTTPLPSMSFEQQRSFVFENPQCVIMNDAPTSMPFRYQYDLKELRAPLYLCMYEETEKDDQQKARLLPVDPYVVKKVSTYWKQELETDREAFLLPVELGNCSVDLVSLALYLGQKLLDNEGKAELYSIKLPLQTSLDLLHFSFRFRLDTLHSWILAKLNRSNQSFDDLLQLFLSPLHELKYDVFSSRDPYVASSSKKKIKRNPPGRFREEIETRLTNHPQKLLTTGLQLLGFDMDTVEAPGATCEMQRGYQLLKLLAGGTVWEEKKKSDVDFKFAAALLLLLRKQESLEDWSHMCKNADQEILFEETETTRAISLREFVQEIYDTRFLNFEYWSILVHFFCDGLDKYPLPLDSPLFQEHEDLVKSYLSL
jgi:hypothetical protein